MLWKIKLPNGKTSKDYTEDQIIELHRKSRIPDGSEVLSGVAIDAWIESRTVDDSPPATKRQKEYASELGVVFEDGISKRQIGALISAAVTKRDAEMFEMLESIREGEEEIRREFAAELLSDEATSMEDASIADFMHELENRGQSGLIFTMAPDFIDAILSINEGDYDVHDTDFSMSASTTEDIGGANMDAVLMGILALVRTGSSSSEKSR